MGAGGERQPGTLGRRLCQRCARGAAHRGSGQVAPEAARHATSADYTAVHRRQPARLRPTTPRRCGSCAAAFNTRQRSPARWSAHAPAATACKRPRARSVVRTPGRHSERAMGAALTRPTGITSAPAGAVRAAFDHFDPDRRGLWVRHADTHAQANSYRPRAHPGRMSAHTAAAAAQCGAGVSVAMHEVSLARDRNFGRHDRSFGAKPRWSTIGPPGFSVESAALPGPPPRTFTTK
jgi:hypothetical protein